MDLQGVVKKFRQYPHWAGYGAGKLSRMLKCTIEDVHEARKIVRGKKSISLTKDKLPKILVFDIETSPSITYTFRRFKENISLDQVEQDPIMLTWSAKWLYSADVMTDAITPNEVLEFNDYRIVKSLWDLLNEADVVVAHYGDGFDIPMLNARAIINGLDPYNITNSIDTKKVASKQFKFPSNKLDALASYFGFGGKIKTEFDLWKNCMYGKQEAIDEMLTYNIQDVKVLEEVYLKLRPWIKSHPNVALYNDIDESQCANCGSTDITPDGYYFTNTGKYQTYRCSCGAISRGRTTIVDKNKRKSLLVSAAK